MVTRKGRKLQFHELAKSTRRLPHKPTAALLKAVCRASAWLERFKQGEVSSYYDLTRLEKFALLCSIELAVGFPCTGYRSSTA
jgi:hypothetical protein